jgi:hypothetical protein
MIAMGLVLLGSCGIDPRWGEPGQTNPSLPGSPGVDARWGEPRSGLSDNLRWQYEGLPEGSGRARK